MLELKWRLGVCWTRYVRCRAVMGVLVVLEVFFGDVSE